VGDVTDAAMTAAVRGTDLPVVGLDAASRGRYPGLFRGATQAGASAQDQLRVFINDGQLFVDSSPDGTEKPDIRHLVPLGAHTFAYGRFEDGVIVEAAPTRRARFVETAGAITALEVLEGSGVVQRFQRAADVVLPPADIDRLIGRWAPEGAFTPFAIEREGSDVVLILPNRRRHTLIPVTATRFLAPSVGPQTVGVPGGAVEFEVDGTGARAMSLRLPGIPPIRMVRRP